MTNKLQDAEVIHLISCNLYNNVDIKDFENWVAAKMRMQGPYPWLTDKPMQNRMNCLLRHELTLLGYDTYHLRSYLEDSDPPQVWAKGVAKVISGHIDIPKSETPNEQ